MKAKRVWRILNPRFKNIYIYIYRLSTVEAPTIPCCHCFIPTHCALPRPLPKLQPRLPQTDFYEARLDGLRHRCHPCRDRSSSPTICWVYKPPAFSEFWTSQRWRTPEIEEGREGRDDFQVGELMELCPFQKIIQFPMLVNQKLGKPWAHCSFAFIREMFNLFSEAFHLA